MSSASAIDPYLPNKDSTFWRARYYRHTYRYYELTPEGAHWRVYAHLRRRMMLVSGYKGNTPEQLVSRGYEWMIPKYLKLPEGI